MKGLTCLITGCTLFVEAEGKQVHGDLHALGYTFIFNACLNEDDEAAWVYNSETAGKVVTIAGAYFERRGIIVVNDWLLNDAASICLQGVL